MPSNFRLNNSGASLVDVDRPDVLETILEIDAERRVAHVSSSLSPIFRRRAQIGDDLTDVLSVEAVAVVVDALDNAERTGGALVDLRIEGEVFKIMAKPLSSSLLTLLTIERVPEAEAPRSHSRETLRNQGQFMSAVRRDLATPLSAVVGYANLLFDIDPDIDEDTRSKIVRDMADQAWDLAGTVEDLRTVASLELGELTVADVPVDLRANVAQVIEVMGPRAESVEVDAPVEVVVSGDPLRCRQVIRALVQNALVHGRAPVTIVISRERGHGVLRVRDRGEGVSGAVLEALTRNQVSSSSTGRTAGLGLWTATRLVDLMGGSLTYERPEDETVFRVGVPLEGGR